jgi:hypothetical protein
MPSARSQTDADSREGEAGRRRRVPSERGQVTRASGLAPRRGAGKVATWPDHRVRFMMRDRPVPAAVYVTGNVRMADAADISPGRVTREYTIAS